MPAIGTMYFSLETGLLRAMPWSCTVSCDANLIGTHHLLVSRIGNVDGKTSEKYSNQQLTLTLVPGDDQSLREAKPLALNGVAWLQWQGQASSCRKRP